MTNKLVPEIRFDGFSSEWINYKWCETVNMSTNMVDPKSGDFDNLMHVGPGNIESYSGRLYNNVKTVEEDNLISGKFHFNAGDILYGKINPQLAKFNLAVFEGLASADTYVLNTKNGISQLYLYTIIQTSDFYKYSVSVSRRTGMPKINRDELNQYSYNGPKDYEEQQKIGDFFKNLDDRIALQQQHITLLKETKQGFLQKMFPKDGERVPEVRFDGFSEEWALLMFGDVADIVGGGTPDTTIDEYWNGDVNWFSPAEIGKQRFVRTSRKKITNIGLEKSSAKLLPVGTVLFTSRAGIGNTAILADPASTNQGFQSIVPKKGILDSYFIYSMSNKLKKYGEINGAGSTFTEISGKQLAKMKIHIPTFQEQQKIGEFFKNLDDSIAIHEKELELLQETKKGFLQKMFV
ncbi:restriction endonuclease subunit S [Bacillus daqingensis]|uniref:Restriction endonuclease subunit S n=1 Tax=Bacillus daqingensis TaxID=872396 RepID=A0ABV9NR93_9BACI